MGAACPLRLSGGNADRGAEGRSLLIQSIDTVHHPAITYIPFQIAAARTVPAARSAAEPLFALARFGPAIP